MTRIELSVHDWQLRDLRDLALSVESKYTSAAPFEAVAVEGVRLALDLLALLRREVPQLGEDSPSDTPDTSTSAETQTGDSTMT